MRTVKIKDVPIIHKSQNNVNAVADLTKAIQLSSPLSASAQANVFEMYLYRFRANIIDYDYRPAIADLKAIANANPAYQLNSSNGRSNTAKDLFV